MAVVSDYTALLSGTSFNMNLENHKNGSSIPSFVYVSYAFYDDANIPDPDPAFTANPGRFYPYSEAQKDSFRLAALEFEKVAGIKFIEVTDISAASIRIHATEGADYAGWASKPNHAFSDLVINGTGDFGPGNLEPGSSPFEGMLHELGHTFGLKHPHGNAPAEFPEFNNTLISSMDNENFTQMSYNANGVQNATLAPLDVQALASLYGSPTPFSFVTHKYTSEIVFNTQTEYFTLMGSDFNDRMSGLLGGTTNHMNGNGGNDEIWGREGDDFIYGGYGDDYLYGGAGDDYLDGGAGRNSVWGEAGNDRITLTDGAILFADGGDGIDTIIAPIFKNNSSLDSYDTDLTITLSQFFFTNIENIEAAAGNDRLTGDGAANNISGRAGNDIITGGGGQDLLDGGEGIDTAVYSGNVSNYSISLDTNFISVQDRRSNMDGKDYLRNIENLDFTGNDVDLTLFTGVANNTTADLKIFIEMYIAYFNRAPDAPGLFYWGTRLSEGMTLNQIAESFFVQDETIALYPDPNDTHGFVNSVYDNLLGRTPDIDGFNYWVGELDSGSVSRAKFILAVINGAKAATGSAADSDFIADKGKLGAYFAITKGMSDVDHAKSAMAIYDGSSQSVTAAEQSIDSFYNAALDPNSGEVLINLVGALADSLFV